MKRKLFVIAGILAVLGLIAGVLVYVFVVNKPHTDYAKAKPDVQIESRALFDAYKANATNAATLYNGKVIELAGNLNAVEQTDSLTIAVFEFEEGMFGSEGIRCTMIPEYAPDIARTPPASAVKIKGYCTGYNDTDVILEHCSIVK